MKAIEKLTNQEEGIMQIIGELETTFVKEVLAAIPDSGLHYSTISRIFENLKKRVI